MQPTSVGKAYLVGAGPGDPGYLTVRSVQILGRAEVVIYDALTSPEILALVPEHCAAIEAGKRGGRVSVAQGEINRLLVENVQAGRQVVRLKGGDPFVFGRCTSEIQALVAAGCAFEVVPGISSALAGPLLAGIPLTDPVLSRCFAVASAHEPDALDWQALVQLETLVFLMAGRSLPEIVRQLVRHGRPEITPIAVVRSAAQPEQQVWLGTLGSIVVQTAGIKLSPSIVIVGEVVRLREYLGDWGRSFYDVAWRDLGPTPQTHGSTAADRPRPAAQPYPMSSTHPDDRPTPHRDQATTHPTTYPSGTPGRAISPAELLPLSGRTILVTRAAGQATDFLRQLAALGATAIEVPALEIGPPSSWDNLDGAIASLNQFDWLILTSANGVQSVFDRLQAAGRDARALAGLKIAVVGQKTAQTLAQFGLTADFVPPNFVADSLVATFPVDVAGLRILFPRVESGGREVLAREFRDRGASVTELAAYESRCPQAIAPEALAALQSRSIDAVTFASSKTVRHFHQLLAQAGAGEAAFVADLLQGVAIASIGPQTSATCQELFDRVDVEAETFTLDGLTAALLTWFTTS